MREQIQFTESSLSKWAGMGDYQLVSPDGQHTIELVYDGEPPHGDSYHKAVIDGKVFPAYVWGCMFTFSSCSRYLMFSAMRTKFERLSVVVDLKASQYYVLPEYIHHAEVSWPGILGIGPVSQGKRYTFNGTESWLPC